ncbi:helix-turn-helix domain-containing protein [Vallitalea guaymasensis]|uniref:helix-turn-helix domain-containing protein n=1 Tax=Vallitalea guaymasensis TaxID=1185412 RepID=UPI000DE4966F|nr:helix-turn-helix domain-containing protein [Vallitalea guaymasensis]
MKMFKGNKELNKILSEARSTGWDVDTEEFDKGSDWIWIRDMKERFLQVKYNTCNGYFYVWNPSSDSPVATNLSENMDGVQWYDELLELFYESFEEPKNNIIQLSSQGKTIEEISKKVGVSVRKVKATIKEYKRNIEVLGPMGSCRLNKN